MADFNRTTSAGYRLADAATVGAPTPHSKAAGSVRTAPGKDRLNGVRNDQVWREFVRAERQGVVQWENKWSFLKDYDAKSKHEKEHSSDASDDIKETGTEFVSDHYVKGSTTNP